MEDDVLTQVISVEKEIQALLEAQKTSAREWVEQVRLEAEEEYTREKALLTESSARSAEQARAETEDRARMIITKADEKAGHILRLDDEILRRTVMQRLTILLRME